MNKFESNTNLNIRYIHFSPNYKFTDQYDYFADILITNINKAINTANFISIALFSLNLVIKITFEITILYVNDYYNVFFT